MGRWPIVVGAVALLAAGGWWVVDRFRSPESAPASDPTLAVPLDVPVESTTLASDSDESAQGAATRQFVDTLFVHGVSAILPDPPVGQFYVGWLVKNGNRADAVSTGRLTKQGDTYVLDFSSPVDYSGYREVLVTLQSGERTPLGTDVLKGTFLAE